MSRWPGVGSAVVGPWTTDRPSTERIFKTEMTRPQGHLLALKRNAISAEGDVQPSVICEYIRCHFHEFVALDNWSCRRAAQTALPQ